MTPSSLSMKWHTVTSVFGCFLQEKWSANIFPIHLLAKNNWRTCVNAAFCAWCHQDHLVIAGTCSSNGRPKLQATYPSGWSKLRRSNEYWQQPLWCRTPIKQNESVCTGQGGRGWIWHLVMLHPLIPWRSGHRNGSSTLSRTKQVWYSEHGR